MHNIPQKIHYCWFGGRKKPEKVQMCIQSWRQKCPNFEIIEWNEKNFDITKNQYAYEAYKTKHYAFCSDYVRLWAIYRFGGIYLDTDVELLKDITPLLTNAAFFAAEDNNYIATGLGFGAIPHHPLIKAIMDDYRDITFINQKSRKPDKTPCPQRNTAIVLNQYPKLDLSKNSIQDNILFLSKECFCPLNHKTGELNITNNTYGIHWFHASWMNSADKAKKYLRKAMTLLEGSQSKPTNANKKTTTPETK